MNLHPFTVLSIERQEAAKRSAKSSIHPFGRRTKSNTCKQKSPGTVERVRGAITAHLARHPRDSVAAAHLAKLA
ncbi:hypothetical protein [Devosia elaeis]|uniref:Uncharacterized protein n=1 Tax=Devosia elaeis TaxID=1770058 RepID=A0A178HZN7_9HYPH|nr:hypothetical protein [Devosia elaeis]OAM78199.1 hypothetical protein A3840_06760 [Devosia elaeis]